MVTRMDKEEWERLFERGERDGAKDGGEWVGI